MLFIPRSLCFIESLIPVRPITRRLLLIGIDTVIIVFAVWLSFWLRLAAPFHNTFVSASFWILPTTLAIGLPLYGITGQYKGLTRYVGSRSFYYLSYRNAILVFLVVGVGVIFQLPMPPKSSWILLWLLLTSLTGLVRITLRDLLLSLRSINQKKYCKSPFMEQVKQVPNFKQLFVLQEITR